MIELFVRSVGLWAPGYANPRAWCREEVDEGVEGPPAALLRGALRRRATAQTRAAVEALGQVVEGANWDGSKVATIWGTAHGEHTTSISMFEWMARGEGKLSPTQFHNSVHNAAGGYASIATKNTTTSTTLTGAGELVVSGLVEAMGLLKTDVEEVALVFFDEALQGPFAVPRMESTLAVGFGLTLRPGDAIATLGDLARNGKRGLPPEKGFAGLHVAAALPLLRRVVEGQPGRVALQIESESAPVWSVEVDSV